MAGHVVETAGAFAELRNLAMPTTYPELDPRLTHITLVERLPHVLATFSPRLRSYAQRALVRRGVDLRLDTAVKEVHPDGVMLDGDEFLGADMVVWASGVTVHEHVSTWGLPQGRGGRIRVDDRLRVQGMDPGLRHRGRRGRGWRPKPCPNLPRPRSSTVRTWRAR